jgi:hypothetical protein
MLVNRLLSAGAEVRIFSSVQAPKLLGLPGLKVFSVKLNSCIQHLHLLVAAKAELKQIQHALANS